MSSLVVMRASASRRPSRDHALDVLPPRAPRVRRGPVVERTAVDELAHDVLPPIVLADVVHHDDVRVIEARRGLRLLLEPALRLRIGQLDRQELDRDRRFSRVSVAR